MSNRVTGVVMVIARYFPDIGGMENQCRHLCMELKGRGMQTWVLTRNYHNGPWRENVQGTWVYRAPTFGRNRFINSFAFIAFSVCWLFWFHRRFQIIHCHQSYSPLTIGVAAVLVLRAKGIVVKMTASNEYGEVNELKKLPFFRLRRWMMDKVDRFLIVNPEIATELDGIGVRGKHVQWMPNGVYLPRESVYAPGVRMQNRMRKGWSEKEKIVIFTGRLSEEKNLHILLEAFAQVRTRLERPLRLLIVGAGGSYRNVELPLKTVSAHLGLQETVIFTGKVSDVSSYLLCADLFVLPSVSEGMSNSLLEAMAHGLPCLVTDIPANRSLIEMNVQGHIVPVGSVEALRDAMIHMLESESQSAEMGKKARERMERDFSMPIIGERIAQMYEEICQNK